MLRQYVATALRPTQHQVDFISNTEKKYDTRREVWVKVRPQGTAERRFCGFQQQSKDKRLGILDTPQLTEGDSSPLPCFKPCRSIGTATSLGAGRCEGIHWTL